MVNFLFIFYRKLDVILFKWMANSPDVDGLIDLLLEMSTQFGRWDPEWLLHTVFQNKPVNTRKQSLVSSIMNTADIVFDFFVCIPEQGFELIF